MNVQPLPHRISHPGRVPASRGAAAIGFTAAVALLAWVLAAIVRLPEQAVVLGVMSVAFAASWAITNRRPSSRHRVTLIRVPVRTH